MQCPDNSVSRRWRRLFTKQTINQKTHTQVLLAKLKADNKFYAVKVLQKKVILKKKEVRLKVSNHTTEFIQLFTSKTAEASVIGEPVR